MQKKTSRKPPGKKTRSAASSKFNANRFLLVVTLLIFVVTVTAITAHFLIPRRKAPLPEKPAAKAIATAPHYEIFPKETSPRIPPVSPPAPTPAKILPEALPKPDIRPGALPKVAIIIDDMGFDQIMTRKFIQLDAVLTYSILPFSPLQSEVQEAATKRRLDTMLHLPMEPIEYPTINPGRGALLTTMPPDELIDQLKKNLRAVPGIVGVNNHMGSKMTEVSDQLNQIFSVLKKEGVFFIDSRTTPASLCRPAARLFRIPFGERDIFLDHVQKPEIIREQILQLIRIAIEKGEAIGIGHPHSVTYEVLLEMLPEINRKVKLVPASEVVHLQS
jgi:uncharacterized protein